MVGAVPGQGEVPDGLFDPLARRTISSSARALARIAIRTIRISAASMLPIAGWFAD